MWIRCGEILIALGRPGGSIMIHGLQKYLARLGFLADVVDWTDGCIAVTHGDIEEVWQLVSVDTPVGIRP